MGMMTSSSSPEEDVSDDSALDQNVYHDLLDEKIFYGTTRPMRLLCLHGYGSNNDITAFQMSSLGLQRFVEVDLFHGGIDCGPSDGKFQVLSERPFHAWYHDDVGPALRRILAVIQRHGPYDGLYGFSQGAALVAMLSIPGVPESFGFQRSWRFVVCAGGATVGRPLQAVTAKNGGIDLPSLHLIGSCDPFRGMSEALAKDFQCPTIVFHSHGHELPIALRRDTSFAAKVHAFLRDLGSSV